jgi:hypothetical protein
MIVSVRWRFTPEPHRSGLMPEWVRDPARELVGRPRKPRVLPFLDLIGQPLEAGSHAEEPLPHFRVSRLGSERPERRSSR